VKLRRPARRLRRLGLVAAALALAAPAALHAPAARAAKPVSIRLASFAPEGSIWDKALRQMADEVRRDTQGRVTLTVFAGGQQGEEPSVVSKMRLGALQSAALTSLGLVRIDPAFNVFSLPFFYDSYEELERVRAALTPELEKRLAAQGFVLLSWGDAGWLEVFTKPRVTSLPELKRIKLYTSPGDDKMVQWYKQNGFEPRPLAFSDIPTALATGLLEGVPITPLAALFLQWYRAAPHMLDVGLSPLVGASVVTQKTWSALDAADREALRTAARRMEERLRSEVPEQDRVAIEEMKRRGLEVLVPVDAAAWREAGSAFAQQMRGNWVPEPIFDRALAERDAYRRGVTQGASR
jgi:TRAP-type C4-dicarboxylate transport system substrate-binding protein